MSDYTPTTERVRNSYANDIASYPKPANVFEAAARADSAKEEFDRWLTEHDRQKQAEAWDEGYDTSVMDSRLPVQSEATVNPYREVTE